MANNSLEDHKSRIIHLYREDGCPEEDIVDVLGRDGVQTDFAAVQTHLEKWHVIPSPSPVLSKDSDEESAQSTRPPPGKLSGICHHGQSFHVSHTFPASIPSDPSAADKYQIDRQLHEDVAVSLELHIDGEDTDVVCPVSEYQLYESRNRHLSELKYLMEDYEDTLEQVQRDPRKHYLVQEYASLIKQSQRQPQGHIHQKPRRRRPREATAEASQ